MRRNSCVEMQDIPEKRVTELTKNNKKLQREIGKLKVEDRIVRESDEILQLAYQNAPFGILMIDLKGNFIDVNVAAEKLTGYARDELIGKSYLELKLVSPNLVSKAAGLVAMIAKCKSPDITTFPINRKNGEGLQLSLEAYPVRTKHASVALLVLHETGDAAGGDVAIADNKKIESSMESMVDGVTIIDVNGRITYINQGALDQLGFTREQCIGKTPADIFISQGDMKKYQEQLSTALAGGLMGSQEYEIVRKDGSLLAVEVNVSVVKDNDGNPTQIVVVHRDITKAKARERSFQEHHNTIQVYVEELEAANDELKHNQEKLLDTNERFQIALNDLKDSQSQLLQSAKLAAVGELVSGVAHELNNPLMIISTYSELLLGKVTDEGLRVHLEEIRTSTERATSIICNLLSFARKQEPRRDFVSVNDIVHSILGLRSYDLRIGRMEVVPDLDVSDPHIRADFQQLQQVFLNLMINAEQAVLSRNDSGKLTIRTRQVGDLVQVTFTDNGRGISRDIMDRIFEPFFTTKDVGEGTGLGLSICYGIVSEHNGKISVESLDAQGATFTVEFPAVAQMSGGGMDTVFSDGLIG